MHPHKFIFHLLLNFLKYNDERLLRKFYGLSRKNIEDISKQIVDIYKSEKKTNSVECDYYFDGLKID
jgi:predicted RecB family nuclease